MRFYTPVVTDFVGVVISNYRTPFFVWKKVRIVHNLFDHFQCGFI